jgi:TolB-like protein/Flp pilus assembly protein TadD
MVKPDIAAYEFGHFRLNLAEHHLLRDGQTVPLTAKLFDILLLLVRGSGKVVTKETLMKEVWPGTFVEENNLTVSISALRKILGERHREHEYIETVPKRGYRFVARVKEIQDEESTGQTGVRLNRADSKTADELDRAVRALAVLPLVNVGEDLDLEYLSDGITESIINNLSRLPQLRVMARNTVFRYKGHELDARQIGRQLNVPAVLIGRLRQLNKYLILGVELVNVSDGSQLWGEQYNRRFSDIFRVQAEIAREISEKLRIKLTGEERERLTKRYTENSEAYKFYLKGRYFWNKRTVKSINRGLQYFKEAIALDANFALAYAGLADCYTSLIIWNALQTTEAVTAARRAAVKALALDEALAEAHASLAFIEMLALNWSEGEREFRRAIELNPNNALTRSRYAVYLAGCGRLAQATTEIEQALKTDPLSPLMHTNAARILFYARQYERSIEQCCEALEIDPRFGSAYGVLGLVYERLAKYEESIAALRKALSLMEDDTEALSILGYIYAVSGKRREARTVLDKLQRLSEQKYVPPFFRALIHIGLKEKEEAFEWLEKSYQERSYILTHLNILPIFDYLRADPRFSDLLRRIGLSD